MCVVGVVVVVGGFVDGVVARVVDGVVVVCCCW